MAKEAYTILWVIYIKLADRAHNETRLKVKPLLTGRSCSHCPKAQNWEQKREPEHSLFTALSLDLLSLSPLEGVGFVAPPGICFPPCLLPAGLPAHTARAAPKVLRGHRCSPPRRGYQYVTVMRSRKMESSRADSVRQCWRGEGCSGALAVRGVMHPPSMNSSPCRLTVSLSFCKVLWCLLVCGVCWKHIFIMLLWNLGKYMAVAPEHEREKGLTTLFPARGCLGETDPDEL